MGLVRIEQRQVGALTKNEAIDFVGGEKIFNILVTEFGLVPFYAEKNSHRYRVAGLESAMLEMELAAMQQAKRTQVA